MAAASSVSEKTVEQLQKLSLGSQAKPQNALEATKKVLSNERSVSTLLQDIDTTTGYPSNGYQEVYYGSYDGSTNGWDYNGPANGWDGYVRSVTPDGAERLSGAHGYASYSPYTPPVSPVPTLGHDGLFYGTQHYQYSGPFCQQPAPSNSSITANNQLHPVDATKANSKYGANGNTSRSNTRSSYTWYDAYSGGRPRPLTSSSVSITAS